MEAKIEAILFWRGEPTPIDELAKVLEAEESEIEDALTALGQTLEERGISLVRSEDGFSLATNSEMAPVIKAMLEEERSRPLSRASLETLAIICYKAPVRKADIDYIRGVDSSSILRALLVRGLVEKNESELISGSYAYYPARDLLLHLGIKSLNELPDYESVINSLSNENVEENSDDLE